MKTAHFSFLAAALMLIVSCKPGVDTVTPETPVPTPTQPGAVTEAGRPVGPSVTQVIGPAGGTVTSADGKLQLTIPAGALAKETPVSIQAVENKAPNGSGTAYTFGQGEITVSEPLILTYQYRQNEFSGAGKNNVGLARQNSGGVWGLNQLAVVDPVKRTLTARVRRVSQDAIAWIERYKMTPETDTLVYLQERNLTIMYQSGGFDDVREIDGKPSNYDLFLPLGSATEAGISVIRHYGINGDQLGVNNDGNLALLKDQASNPNARALLRYQAPNRAPRTNPVAVHVELEHGGKEKLLLVSNLVVRNPVWFGVNGVVVEPVTAAAAVTPTGLTVMLTQDGPVSGRSHLSLFVRAPKTARFSFNQHDAIAQLSYVQGGRSTTYSSAYDDEKKVTHFMDGEINLLDFDRSKGLVQGLVRGTLVYKKPNRHDDGYTLETVNVSGEFKCKFGQ
ncbi:hypothetical protein [Tellurirhabdus rosea]|uniref:hypothetical protein n=1 Tax=Tellurirhabdus rosea TaxID=2674997 RepID=UPI0022578342|nr:hypothetical protein [Tellurirhabdus rosea]